MTLDLKHAAARAPRHSVQRLGRYSCIRNDPDELRWHLTVLIELRNRLGHHPQNVRRAGGTSPGVERCVHFRFLPAQRFAHPFEPVEVFGRGGFGPGDGEGEIGDGKGFDKPGAVQAEPVVEEPQITPARDSPKLAGERFARGGIGRDGGRRQPVGGGMG